MCVVLKIDQVKQEKKKKVDFQAYRPKKKKKKGRNAIIIMKNKKYKIKIDFKQAIYECRRLCL